MEIICKNSGARIDKFLMEEVFFNSDTTRGEVIRNIKDGRILVNGETVKPSYILKRDDEISSQFAVRSSQLVANKNVKFEIIYEDKNIIVVNKPAGISVHPNDVEKENTLVNALVANFPEIKSINDGSEGAWMRPGIVHRLDKDTSGAMVVARNQKTFVELKRKFADREIEKNYVALVYGHLEKKSGIVDAPIARSASFKKQKIAYGKIKGTARPAVTEYKLLKRYSGFDFVEALPKTGRMHQIRVHLAYLGHPIVGDAKYKRKDLIQPTEVTRQLLHAQKLKFELWGKKYSFEARLPKDFEAFIRSLDPPPTLKNIK
jgi:23S rRNA pseudouridine1911/1915/1917 synthase